MILVSILAVILFLGGWHSPFGGSANILWLFAKTGIMMLSFLWFRATFPRYRYDQIMRLGWKIYIPITLIWVVAEAFAIQFNLQPWFVS